ncbi:PAS domain-containing protein [Oricola cellulosilytica]|uniref:PAS domain-containing protein n=1 Tax=Oricola cellulosilytica TaxID=1429082 RepID=A0A4R0PDE5_9HYPH|nr:PAS domain-containing protein [Oricola cellulosilytica]TCD14583.1 PAS domain-containing protein [Oricola cellulosilytica]
MRHKNTLELYRYWNGLRAGKSAPLRSQVAPAALANILPAVMLLESTTDGDAVFRVAGTRVCAIPGRELRGDPLSGMFDEADRKTVRSFIRSVERDHSVALLDALGAGASGRTVTFELAFFPLAGSDTNLIGICNPLSLPIWLGAERISLALRGVRTIDPEADLVFLQNRPSIPVKRSRLAVGAAPAPSLSVIAGEGERRHNRPLHGFRVYDGGKK